MLLRLFPHICNACILGYASGAKQAKIPWAKLCKDPSSWIEPECTPDGFQWADPSKICIGKIFRLLDHWRERQQQHLNPLIWVTSCPLLKNASSSLEDRQHYQSDHSTDSSPDNDDRVESSSPDPHPNSEPPRLNPVSDSDLGNSDIPISEEQCDPLSAGIHSSNSNSSN